MKRRGKADNRTGHCAAHLGERVGGGLFYICKLITSPPGSHEESIILQSLQVDTRDSSIPKISCSSDASLTSHFECNVFEICSPHSACYDS